MDPICPENCLDQLPSLSVASCNPVLKRSAIQKLYIGKANTAPFSNWAVPTEWTTRLSNSSTNDDAIRFLLGTGSLPAGTPQTVTYQVNKIRQVGNQRTLQFIVEEANPTIHEFLRQLECGGEYRVWFETIGGNLYGGNEGVLVQIAPSLILNSGAADIEQRQFDLSWDGQFTPEMVTSPITGFTDNLPTVYDTILTFLAGTTDAKEGVTGNVSGTNAITKFEFNKLVGGGGTPITMTINHNGFEAMQIVTTTTYAGRSFRYTHPNGAQFTGAIINGTVSFTGSSS